MLVLVGCGQQPAYNPPADTQPTANNYTDIPSTTDEDWEANHQNINWISPGKVTITVINAHLGTPASNTGYSLRIHNGGDYATTFRITVTAPNTQQLPGYGDFPCTNPVYEPLPPEHYSWIHITNPTPFLLAKETKEVWIGFNIPARDKPWSNRYEVQTRVQEAGQAGPVVTATATRWQLDLQ